MSTDWPIQETEKGYLAFVAEVLDSRPLTPTSHHLRVTRHPAFDFEPVQYTRLTLDTGQGAERFDEARPMSLASSPTRDHLEYGVRTSDSRFKQPFVALEPGDAVHVVGPAGEFVLEEGRPAVLVAGGVGITPLKGMAEFAADRDLPVPVRLLYSNRTAEEIAYREELDDLVEANPRFEVLHTLTREPTGSEWDGRRRRIDRELLTSVADDLEDAVYYLCGTPGMVQDLSRTLREAGVAGGRIKFEKFWGY